MGSIEKLFYQVPVDLKAKKKKKKKLNSKAVWQLRNRMPALVSYLYPTHQVIWEGTEKKSWKMARQVEERLLLTPNMLQVEISIPMNPDVYLFWWYVIAINVIDCLLENYGILNKIKLLYSHQLTTKECTTTSFFKMNWCFSYLTCLTYCNIMRERSTFSSE